MSCGEKAGGKLGLGQETQASVIHFTEISKLSDQYVNFISVKKKHCLAITSLGKAFSWGLNDFGQLG